MSNNSIYQNHSEYTIRKELPGDFRAVEELTREAFWNVYRPGCLEHYVLHCYRNHPDFIPELSLVLEGPASGGSAVCASAGTACASAGTACASAGTACASGDVPRREILAHVMFAWSEILVDPQDGTHAPGEEQRHLKMMTFGPISVRPDMQRKGLGKMLLDFALERAAQMGAGCIAMCGNIQFYGKCGFVVATSRGIRYAEDPDGEAPYFLIRELTPGFLDGIRGSYRDPEPYFVCEGFEEYDSTFPPREKKVMPGQLG